MAALSGARVGLGEWEFKHGVFRLEKRWGDNPLVAPYEVSEYLNAYTNVGGALLLDLLIGAGGTAFNNANAYTGVGDSSTAFAVGQTDLQAATNKLRKAMDATFPSRSSQVVTWKSTYATSDANWTWAECALFNAAAAGTMLCRIVQAMGTKTSAASWTLSYTITVP